MRVSQVVIITLGMVAVSALPAAAKSYRLTVAAAPEDRAGEVARFSLPADAPRAAVARDAAGHALPVQIDDHGVATFIIPLQKAGTVLTYTLEEGKAPSTAGVSVVHEPGRLRLSVDGHPSLYYQMDKEKPTEPGIDAKYLRGGFIHPVLTPSGTCITDSYPKDHRHHHGIWSPWTKTHFQGRSPDFWNMGQGTGTVEFAGLDRTWSGPVDGGFESRHRFVDLSAPSPVVALNETWLVTVYDVPGAAVPVRLFDMVITQTCATKDPLILPEYRYGGLAYRGNRQWKDKTKVSVLTSDGVTDRVKANATRVRWCYLGGLVDGAEAGAAVLSSPDNFRFPQPVRVHPDDPYLCFAPSELGDWEIKPGEPYVARYRFVVADGQPDKTLLDAYWNGYAHPAAVTVSPL